ncbi:MAG TPA: helix-turn-helix domain-containing protein, partial [Streptomyces sp.]
MRRTQQDRSAGTKAALVAAARELFATRGYQAVPADEITRAAGVTRGALYHHYADKQGLFRAVVEEVERELTEEIEAAFAGAADPLTGMALGLGVFLDACLREE